MGNGYLLHTELSVFCSHGSQSDFLIEAPPAAASGVEPEHAIPFLAGILVGVAVDHYIHVGQIRGHVPLIVNQKDADTTSGEGGLWGKSSAHSLSLLPRTMHSGKTRTINLPRFTMEQLIREHEKHPSSEAIFKFVKIDKYSCIFSTICLQ